MGAPGFFKKKVSYNIFDYQYTSKKILETNIDKIVSLLYFGNYKNDNSFLC